MQHPHIIQGGMGVGVSHWYLARKVAEQGQLGVVSGTALDVVLARRLQQGDPGGHMLRALKAFPDQAVAENIINKFYNEGQSEEFHDFSQVPVFTINPIKEVQELTVVANFVEIYLAKEGHDGKVGINYLEKIQMPNPASIYGAMLAGVDYILVGAGIPIDFPQLIDNFTASNTGSIPLHVEGAQKEEKHKISFNPSDILKNPPEKLKRPYFFPIVSSFILAMTMAKKAKGRVDGLILENHTAGGHNAPPRGVMHMDENGEPVYGEKDEIDYKRIADLGLPFWIAGGFSTVDSFEYARANGASGIQIGSLFAFCRESGLLDEIKKKFLALIEAGKQIVFTDPNASPTGFPFKVAAIKDTISQTEEFLKRKRVCNLGYLRKLFRKKDGTIGYKCPAEPIEGYKQKNGTVEETEGKKCLCNSLLANIGLAKKYARGYIEKPLITVGEYLDSLRHIVREKGLDYTASDVISMLISNKVHTKV